MRTSLLARVRGVAPTVLLGAIVGLLAGYLWARQATLGSAQERLVQFAERIRSNGERSSDEAREVLRKINAMHYAPCSHEELEAFRQMLYTSEYLKDVARVTDGKLQCSAMLSILPRPGVELGNGFVRPDGARVYRNLEPYRIPGETAVAVQSGEALIVYSPYNLRPFEAHALHFFVSDRDLSTGRIRSLIGDVPKQPHPEGVFLKEGTARFGNVLFATRCSQRYASCMTTYMTIPEALQFEANQLRIYVGLSTLCGALLGLIVWLLYRRNRSIEQQLRRAIRRGQLGVVYQPIFDLQSGRAIAAEALARWADEDGFPISPDIFIKVAEDRGFIGEITRFMVNQTVRALRQISTIDSAFRINVNIAPADVNDPEFLPMLTDVFQRTPMPARCLGFEITESSWAEWDSAHGVLLKLREMGHLVHIDDFGKGYSSLAYLHNLPVDVLKIDKEFTQSIGTESVKISIVPQILSMASSLNLKVVVEGIETKEQAQYYAGCRPSVLAQGWYLGSPMSLEELLQLLRNEDGGGRSPRLVPAAAYR